MSYYFSKTLDSGIEESRLKVMDALKAEGFGIITEVAMHEKFKEKLDKEYRPYYILGACNPALAYEAVHLEQNVGLLLPCNVVVYQVDDNRSGAAFVDAEEMMKVAGNPDLSKIARKVNEHLQKALQSI